jgi:hypothetical protein
LRKINDMAIRRPISCGQFAIAVEPSAEVMADINNSQLSDSGMAAIYAEMRVIQAYVRT